ncbi:uncharacterized protein [Penaeus vannamei]|uniref:uncharacterized protein n=1 Tax=Penaeus vannamei TaxID=6689 RepID=UPI00387F6792
MLARVQDNGETSDPFPVSKGVKQGCVLAPTLFSLTFSAMLTDAFRDSDIGIGITYRTDGSIFNLRRLQAKPKVSKDTVNDFLFADDCALNAATEADMQCSVDKFSEACNNFGLTINTKKIEVMHQPAPGKLYAKPNITVNGQRLNTKIKVCRAIVLKTLLYGCETWTVYQRHARKLNHFHNTCLRKLLGIKWQDRIPDTEVLTRAGLPSIYTILMQSQLRWTGHVVRMPDHRLPKRLLYGKLQQRKRSKGGQKKPFRVTLKASLKAFDINHNSGSRQLRTEEYGGQLYTKAPKHMKPTG